MLVLLNDWQEIMIRRDFRKETKYVLGFFARKIMSNSKVIKQWINCFPSYDVVIIWSMHITNVGRLYLFRDA